MAALETYCKFPVNDFTFKNKDIVEKAWHFIIIISDFVTRATEYTQGVGWDLPVAVSVRINAFQAARVADGAM